MTDEHTLKDSGFDELEREYQLIAATDQAPLAKLGLYATTSMNHLVNLVKPFQILKEKGPLIAVLQTSEGSWHSRVVDIIATTLEEAVQTGAIRPIETRRVGAMFLDAILSLMAHRLDSAEPDDIEDDVRLLMDLYLNGLMIRY